MKVSFIVIGGIVLAIAVAAGVVLAIANLSSSSSDRSGAIAANIGASSCGSSGYDITSNITGRRVAIYECLVGSKLLCVTEDHGIAHDSTDVVKLLFADTLGAAKPGCVT